MEPNDSPRPWWRPAWYELVPEIVLVVGLGWFLIDEPDAATSALKSTRAVGLMVAGGLAWIIGRIVLARFVPWRSVRMAVLGLAALGALAVIVLPAYDDETVVEAFPAPPAADVAPTTTLPPTTSPTTTSPDTVPAPAAPGDPPSTPAPAVPVTTAAPSIPTTTVAAEPMQLRTGPFMGIDHRAEGTVSIYRTPDGRHVVGLETFDIQPGPDYDVYVVPGADQDGTGGGTRLDDLRGNQGTQYYDVPAGVDVATGDWTVLIWCQTFGVPVANATPI